MEVGHALADPVVHADEGALGFDGHPNRPAQAAGGVEQRGDQLRRQIVEGLDVATRHQQDMAGEHRPLVEEGHRFGLVEHDVGTEGAGDDLAEGAVGHGEERYCTPGRCAPQVAYWEEPAPPTGGS